MPSYPPPDDSMIPFITRALRNGREKEYHAMGTFKISTEEEALADNVFVAFNTRRRREQLVVKLMDDDIEMDFMNYMNRRDIPELFNHVVEWKDWGDITFPNNIGQCIGLVLEAGTATLENRLRESVMKEDEYAKYSCVAHLINGVKLLHAQNIIHGNISLDNILYFGDKGHFKFIDFAASTLINQPMQSMCTPEYCPPEMAKHLLNPTPEGIPAKAEYDIWSLAVVILKMFMPNFTLVEFVHKSDRAVLEMIASDDFTFKRSFEACTLSTPQKDDLAKCLNLEPTARASLQSLWSLLPRKTTMDANIRRVERQLMANQKTQVQLDKYKVPCLWTLEDTKPNPSGFMARGKRLLMKEFRIVFLCELRDEKPCEHYDDEAPIIKANSDLIKKALPVLKASCLVVKALGLVVGWGGIIGDYFNFDLSKYTTLETVMDAVSSVNDIVERLDLEEKLSSVVEKLEEDRDEISEEEVQSLMADIKDAFVKFRDDPETYQKLLSLLDSVKFDWQKKVTIGGLEKKVVRIDDVKNNPDATGDASEAGEVRWVCKAHAETFPVSFPFLVKGRLSIFGAVEQHVEASFDLFVAVPMKGEATGPNMKNTRKISPELVAEKGMAPFNPSSTAILDLKAKQHGRLHKQNTLRYTPRSKLHQRALALLDAIWFSVLMNAITLYCLFGDDFRVAFASKAEDSGFFGMAGASFILFTIEFLLSCYAKPDYIGSFYFYLDSIATISLVPDIGNVWSLIVGTGSGHAAAQSAGKTGRILRVVRIVRLIRIVKLIKWRHDEEQKQVSESKTGGRMAEMTTRRVVMIVIFLCFVLPAFDGGYNDPINSFESKGFETLHVLSFQKQSATRMIGMLSVWVARTTNDLLFVRLYNNSADVTAQWLSQVRFVSKDLKQSNLTADPTTGWTPVRMIPSEDIVLATYRPSDLRTITITGCYTDEIAPRIVPGDCSSVAYFDIAGDNQSAAKSSMLKTIFIMVVLIGASISFVRVARKIVLDPIERMMETVHRLALNPLGKHATVEADDQKEAKAQGFETALLESTLDKISALMQVGFGAAGADIIGKNMGAGDVDPMLPGKKITAIYGFCDIRQFTDTTECLQEEVMVYVNKLGNIMHSGTHAYYGMANKNVGDAFLLSWKICDGELPGFSRFADTPTEEHRKAVNASTKCPPNSGAGKKSRRITPTEMADSALTAFIKCMIDLDNANSFGVLHEYIVKDVVVKRFGPGFRIQMGFGMHVGWAIEGAIGSRFKIDATYISPHVEMADRLEAGSKIFKTKINVSHWLYALLSPAARKFMRKMDTIQIRGVDTPLTVYTFDVTNPKNGFATPKFDEDERGQQVQRPVDFANDPEYKEIREGLDPAFLESAAEGVELYQAGDWTGARQALSHALQLRPADGPCKYLMDFLQANNFEAPPDWNGVRTLDGY